MPQTYPEQLLAALSAWIGWVADVEWTDAAGDLVGFTGKILGVWLTDPGVVPTTLTIDVLTDGQTLRYTIEPFCVGTVQVKQVADAPPGPEPVDYGMPQTELILDAGGALEASLALSPAALAQTAPFFNQAPAAPDVAVIPAWYVTHIPDDFTPGGPDDPWRNEPLFQYISGTAGTGKTYAQKLRAEVDPRAKLTATTGIAAINLGGQTINSLLHYKDTPELATAFELGKLNHVLGRLASSGFTRLIIDEVSMMDGRQLDVLCEATDRLNERLTTEGEPLMGITLVGDFCQLSPVKAPFVFERPGAWARFQDATVRLTEPRRQADPDFVRALQAVRRGDNAPAVEYFTPMIKNTIDGEFSGSTIMAKNDEVERHNALRLNELTGRAVTFTTKRAGVQAAEWKHIPATNRMKLGALVMILANKREKGTYFGGEEDIDVERKMIYANGDLGILEEVEEATVSSGSSAAGLAQTGIGQIAHVRLHRNGAVVQVAEVERTYKEATGAKGEKKERETKTGSIQFMPLRVAWATTVHKSQGLSLDRVQVVMNNAFFGHPGMLYVALSRARTPQGLRLVGSGASQLRARIKVDPKVLPYL